MCDGSEDARSYSSPSEPYIIAAVSKLIPALFIQPNTTLLPGHHKGMLLPHAYKQMYTLEDIL